MHDISSNPASPIGDAVHVTSAEFVRQFGTWQDRASSGPVIVTHHGRDRLVVLSPGRFAELATNNADNRGASDDPDERQSFSALEIVADYLDECFIAFDHDLRVVLTNSAIRAYLRLARGQLEGRTLASSVPQSSGSLGSMSIESALNQGQVATLEVPSVIYPGRWLRVKTFPFPSGSACLFRDVTDEVEARDAINIQIATRQAMLAHGMIGRCVLTARATFREVDETFAGLLDLEPRGLLRARFTDIFPTSCRAEAREAVEAVLDTGVPVMLDTRLLRRGHAEEAVRLSIAPLASSQDRGAVVIATRQ